MKQYSREAVEIFKKIDKWPVDVQFVGNYYSNQKGVCFRVKKYHGGVEYSLSVDSKVYFEKDYNDWKAQPTGVDYLRYDLINCRCAITQPFLVGDEIEYEVKSNPGHWEKATINYISKSTIVFGVSFPGDLDTESVHFTDQVTLRRIKSERDKSLSEFNEIWKKIDNVEQFFDAVWLAGYRKLNDDK